MFHGTVNIAHQIATNIQIKNKMFEEFSSQKINNIENYELKNALTLILKNNVLMRQENNNIINISRVLMHEIPNQHRHLIYEEFKHNIRDLNQLEIFPSGIFKGICIKIFIFF